MQLSCLLSARLWARTDVLSQRCQGWALAGRIPCVLVGRLRQTLTWEHISRFITYMEGKQFLWQQRLHPRMQQRRQQRPCWHHKRQAIITAISRIASLQLPVWNSKGTRLKPNQHPKIEQKTKSQIVKLKENKKRTGLVLKLLGCLCVSTCWFYSC